MLANAQLAGVRPPVVTSTKLANLPNPRNSIYEVLRSADKNARTAEDSNSNAKSRMGSERSGPAGPGREALWRMTASDCVRLEW